MLLSDRKQSLLTLCLTGMEVAWLAPPALLLIPAARQIPLLAVYAALWSWLLLLMVALDLLNRREFDFPWYEGTTAGLIILSSLLFVWLGLAATGTPASMGWLAATIEAIFDFDRGLRPEMALILVNLALWQRATNATSRDTGFFSVGTSFRLGILLLALGGALLHYLSGLDATPFLWIFCACGLTAVALARIQERSASARSSGAALPTARLAQLLIAVGATVGTTAALATLYTPARIMSALSFLNPLWQILAQLLLWILQIIFWLVGPLILWLVQSLSSLPLAPLEQFMQTLGQIGRPAASEQSPAASPILPPWVLEALRAAGILLLIALAVGFILLYLSKIRATTAQSEAEEEAQEGIDMDPDALRRGLRRLRDLAALARRFGVNRQLLAAISVQNIYANLCRLAARHGHPRRPAQPPDDYLPMLARAFPGQDAALARITALYMRVEYGERPVSDEEMAQMREDYRAIRGA